MEASGTASAGKLSKYKINYMITPVIISVAAATTILLSTHSALLKESFIGSNVVILRETAQGNVSQSAH